MCIYALENLQNTVYNNILVIYINQAGVKGGYLSTMKIIGLTGPSGAGKGTLGSHFAKAGIPVIDADRVYHELLVPPSPCLDALVAEFGCAILHSNGTLDRSALAALVFSDDACAAARRTTLNRITHRFVSDEIRALLSGYEAQGLTAAVIDAPLLIEAGLDGLCDVVVAVLADREIRLGRLMKRDGKGRDALLSRINAQPSDGFYTSRADIVVMNNGDEASLKKQADAVIAQAGLAL